MNRTTLLGILLAISIFVNAVFFVFAYVQKQAAESARDEVFKLTSEIQLVRRESKAQLDTCEGTRAQSEQAREDCERKVLAISNRK